MNTSSFASAINVSSNGISLIEFLYFTYFSPPGFHPRKKTKKTNDEQAKEQAVNWISLYSIISMHTSATTFATASGLAGAPVLYDRGLRLHSFKRKIDETFSSNV